MWSGPRTVSTAMMRAWENRPDTVVFDEPLYAFYLSSTGLDHPGRAGATLATPTTAACPEGITRATVLRLASSSGITCAEGDYTLPQLYNASEVFVTGTMGGLAPVVSVDGRAIGDGTTGPVTKQLTELYANLSASAGTTVA
jgi:branched-chain amino acid aminotransferase